MIKVEKNKTIYKLDGKIKGEVTYPSINSNTVNINHTFVDPSLRGQGIADILMIEVFKYLKTQNLKVVCSCSYASSWLEKHPEYHELKVD